MDNSTKNKVQQIKKLMNLLNKSRLSGEGYQSSQQPFFIQDNQPEKFKIGYKTNPELSDSLNRNFKLLYNIIGDPDREIYINEWTLLSVNEVIKQYKEYCKEGQQNVINLGYRYLGMGHVEVLSCNLYNHLLFLRRDGGSNGYDREANHKEIINFNYRNYEYFYFNQWYEKLNL